MPTDVLLALAALGLVAGYWFACRFWPYAACWRCNGTGKLPSPSGKRFRTCPRCKGTGRRLRLGRHVLNTFSSTRDRAHRPE
ncbi:hypothetical protein ACIB24_12545 [Spongisporangium articulatum]|uniref:Uncharacterized protein n=1 Tax=Spongisporangium articulatum TaxID=3362603 RepID=A0ABW8AND9_9ACTN